MAHAPNLSDHDPIDLRADLFDINDVATLARVSAPRLRSWISRGHAPPGRWFRAGVHSHTRFSICDALRFQILESMCFRTAMATLADAALIANVAIDAAIKSTAPEANSDGKRPNAAALCCWREDGEMVVTTVNIKEPGFYYPPVGDGTFDPLRHPHIYVPATAMLIDLILRTEVLIAGREEPHASTGVTANA